jgi:CelD/BcsL family acetyltransferase involved in cellulose biosynthesis
VSAVLQEAPVAAEAGSGPAPSGGARSPRALAKPAAGALRPEVIASGERLEELRGDWAALNLSARAGCLFLGPEWQLPWWKHFGAGRELRVVALREGPRLVGLLPLFRERVRLGGISARRLAFLGDGAAGCDYLDVLAAPGREDEVQAEALRALLALDWDACELDGLLRESATALALVQRFPPGRLTAFAEQGGAVRREAQLRFVCPYIPLDGSYEEYLATFGRRENLRRREKWLARQPGFEIACARTPEEAAPALEAFFRLHRARWAAEGGSDGLAGERFEEFHRDAVAELARAGMLRLYTLSCARRPVASVYGVVQRNRFLYYQSGYDPLWASRSVGLVLLARTVKDAFAEGLGEFDFLRGNEAYKAQWKRAERWTIRLQLFRGRRGLLGRAALRTAGLLRSAVKSALPGGALSAVRVARRLLRAPPPEGEGRWSAALKIFAAARNDGPGAGDNQRT